MVEAKNIQGALERCDFLDTLYPGARERAVRRLGGIAARFFERFPQHRQAGLYSSPGRSEMGGNHTDHQGGCVITAAVDCDMAGCAAPNGTGVIALVSEGHGEVSVDTADTAVHEEERGTTAALVRGIAARLKQLGYAARGFDAYLSSAVLPGSGLSSSASFEVWVGVAMNGLFCGDEVTPVQIAQIGRYAENVYFGKPSGLEDQMACAVGGITFIDFENMDAPEVRQLKPDLPGYTLCVVDSGGSHADLTSEYAAIPEEMGRIAGYFGQERLRGVKEDAFYAALPTLRREFGDRAVLRACHFFGENERVKAQAQALTNGETDRFLRMVRASGQSSFMYLQNVCPAGAVREQSLAVALAVCDKLLGESGAFRVHGGGFAGTVLAFVPDEMLARFRKQCESLLGEGRCHVLRVRPVGGTMVL
ncbi:MAG TPA: galactokinase [Clostridiales bacterium]|nr:galactokinase [Clostridiales bacterium]